VNGPVNAGGMRSGAARLRRWAAAAVAGVATTGLLAGCGFNGIYGMPLPGGADLGNRPYQVHVQFKDVLDLVPQAGVKVNDVSVGKVQNVGLAKDGWTADVTLAVNGDVKLPANAEARLRQSSLLGEKFIELAEPQNVRPQGRLANGATIPVERTNRNPEVEEVLGALSLLLNGGGVGQLQDITRQLNDALAGRETDVRALLSNVDKLVTSLDAQRDDITRALDAVNRLSASLSTQRANIDTALRDLGPGLAVLNDQRDQLVTMLKSLNQLSGVATNVVNRTQSDLVRDLNDLAPTLRQLAAAGSDLPKSFETLVTFPFPDNIMNAIQGSDYVNLYVKGDLNLTDTLSNLTTLPPPTLPTAPSLPPLPLLVPGGSASPAPAPPPSSLGGLLGGLLGGS
jgi:phospholipid/cholesterol/gamma-HCH transport system substrate-binding protein